MNTKLLKQKILDLAIRGKLTQQLKSDGTAADLLKEICDRTQEKTSLRAKRGNPSPQTIIPLDKSEAPFEIPANWEWVRLGDVAKKITDGTHHSPVNLETGDFMYVTAKNIKDDGIHLENITYVSSDTHKEIFARCNPEKGDVLLIKDGATTGVVTVNNLEEPFSLLSSVALLKLGSSIESWYLAFVIRSTLFNQMIRSQMKGVGITRVTLKQIESFAFPLPPLAEQQRIVEKIQEAFAEIDSIENNKELLKTHIKQTRQKILDLAIHGKLVPQNKSDEPASVLLERITRDNPHYEKLTDIPFEIPDSWEWVKLGDVCKPIKRGKSPKYIEHSNVLVFAQKCNQKDGPVSLEKALYLDESTLNKYPKEEFLQKGDVVINSTGTGTLGRVGYFNVDLPQNIKGIVPDSHVTTIRSFYVNPYYLYCFLKNKQTYLEENGEGSTNQKELKPHTIYDLEFPLPPLAEQKRIVDRIEEIFKSLDEISLHLV